MIEDSIETTRLLVVTRDPAILALLWSAEESNHWRIEIAADLRVTVDRGRIGTAPDVVVLDLPADCSADSTFLQTLRQICAVLPVILIDHPGDHGRAEEYVRMGVRDRLRRPLERHHLETAICRILVRTKEEVATQITSNNVEVTGNGELGFSTKLSDASETQGLIRTLNGDLQAATLHQGRLGGYKSLRALLQGVKQEAERSAILSALETTGWNRKAAARLLKTSYRTVLYKIEQYHLTEPIPYNGTQKGGNRVKPYASP